MYITHKSSFFHIVSNFVTFLMIASCFHSHCSALFNCYRNHFASDVAINQISLIGNNCDNRCHCNVCADGAQSNNSVGAQRNSVTVVDFHADVVILDCSTKLNQIN